MRRSLKYPVVSAHPVRAAAQPGDELTVESPCAVLTVWDAAESPRGADIGPGPIYCWDGYGEEGPVRSLFRYVEAHDTALRSRYLAWIHDLGEYRLAGKTLTEHLTLADGMSYWWMTSFVEKSADHLPIADVLRLFALEDLLLEIRPGKRDIRRS